MNTPPPVPDNPGAPPIPAWAKPDNSIGAVFTYVCELLFFFVAPFVAVLLALMTDQFLLLAMLLAVLVFSMVLTHPGKILARRPFIGRIPLVGDSMRAMERMQDYYFEQRPLPFLAYLFLPFWWPIGFLISPRIRKETKLFAGIFGTIFIATLLEVALSYQDTYPPHLDFADAAGLFAARSLFGFMVLLGYFIPMATTNLRYSLERRKWPQRTLFIVSLFSAVPAIVFYYITLDSSASFMADQRLLVRFDKAEFREDMEDTLDMFIHQYGDEVTPVAEVSEDEELTKRLRHMLDGYLTRSELKAFTTLAVPAGPEGTWIAIRVCPANDTAYLYAVGDGSGQSYYSWNQLPEGFTSQFHLPLEDDDSLKIHDDLTGVREKQLVGDWLPPEE